MAGRSLSEPTDSFGSYLRFLRRRARLTQTALSVAVGYSPGQISMLENGQRTPDVTAVMALFIGALGLQEDRQRAAQLVELARSAIRSQTLAADRPGHGPKVTLQQAVAWQDEELGVLEDIPPLPTCHVARTGADEQIERWLYRERRAVITGLPGMGKSTLAAAFAHRYAQRHPVFWLTFDADRNQTAEEVLRQLALFGLANGAHNTQSPVLRRIAVGVAPGPPRQQLASITAALHALGPALLVFDDAQYAAHHADIMTIFRSLSTGAPYCRLLFIARETFDLADAPHLTLGGLARQEALALLDALETPGATPRLSAPELVEPILTHTAGNPLLLRLAANQIEQSTGLPPAVLGARLAGRLVGALLAWLSPAAQCLLDLLTIWRDPLDLSDPALGACLGRTLPAYDHAAAVNQLLRGQLIEHATYAVIHPLLCEPLLADLQARQAAHRQAQQAAAQWATLQGDLIAAARHHIRAGDPVTAGVLLTDDAGERLPAGLTYAAVLVIDEVIAALRQPVRPSAPRALLERPLLGRLLARRGDWLINTPRAAEARMDYRTAIEVTDEPLAQVRLATRLAVSLLQVGQALDALQLCTDAAQQLTQLEGTEDMRARMHLEGVRARALIGVGQLEEATALCWQAIATARSLRLANPTLAEKICTDSYRGLGYIARRQGRNAEAQPYFARAVSHARSAGLHTEAAETLTYLSATLRELGDFSGATRHAQEALDVAQAAGNDYLAANILHYMSITCYYHNQLSAALAYSQQAAALHQAMGDSEGMVACDILQAVVYAAVGPLSAAVAASERARRDSQLFDNRWLQGMAFYVYGIVHTFTANLPAAEAALRSALALDAFTQDLPMVASALLFLGINGVAQGKPEMIPVIEAQLPTSGAIEVSLLAGLFYGMAHLAAGDAAAAAEVANATRRRGEESGYLIYAAEATQLLRAVAAPPPLAQLPAYVCCAFHGE